MTYGVVYGSTRSDALASRPILAVGACCISPLAPRCTLYCHTVRSPFCASACATALASDPPSALSSSLERPMTISSLTVTTLNRSVLSCCAHVACAPPAMRVARAPYFNVSRRENMYLPLDADDAPWRRSHAALVARCGPGVHR